MVQPSLYCLAAELACRNRTQYECSLGVVPFRPANQPAVFAKGHEMFRFLSRAYLGLFCHDCMVRIGPLMPWHWRMQVTDQLLVLSLFGGADPRSLDCSEWCL